MRSLAPLLIILACGLFLLWFEVKNVLPSISISNVNKHIPSLPKLTHPPPLRNPRMDSTICLSQPFRRNKFNYKLNRNEIDSATLFDKLHAHQTTSIPNYSKFPSCDTAKFAITIFPGIGLAAALTYGPVKSFMAAIQSDRILLILNGNPNVTRTDLGQLSSAWFMSSSGKVTEFFLPLSNCEVTAEEIDKAVFVGKGEYSAETGLGLKYAEDRIVVLEPGAEHSSKDDEAVIDVSKLIGRSGAANRNTYITVIKLYVLRMNEETKKRVEGAVGKSLPSDFDSSATIGLPIRASDKCFAEASCLSFSQYMQIAQNVFEKEKEKDRGGELTNIILTSESKAIIDSRVEFESRFKFFVNENDAMQGSGRPKEYVDSKLKDAGISLSDIMVSTLAALNLQLHSKVTIANCCSNFHKLLGQIWKFAGCGKEDYEDENWRCLDKVEDPELRICCFHGGKKDKMGCGGDHVVGSDHLNPLG